MTNKEHKAEYNKAYVRRAKKARETLVDFVKQLEQAPEHVKEAVRILDTKKTNKVKGRKFEVLDLLEQGIVNEVTLFEKFRIGRTEARNMFNSFLKVDNPDERIWISFDEETGNYELIAKGASVPDGWTGYLPPELKEKPEVEFDDLEDSLEGNEF